MIVDGRHIARELSAALTEAFAALDKEAKLGVLLMDPDFATEKFVGIKKRVALDLGVRLIEERMDKAATTDDVLSALDELSRSSDGVIVQLPLPPHVDTERVIAAIPGSKDVDGIGREARVFSPVGEAMREVLARANVAISGKKAVVIGQGRLVGLPAAKWLTEEGALVTTLTEEAGSVADEIGQADIVISGAGRPGLISPAMLKRGVVLLDAGMSEASGKLAGDADPSCAEVASIFTPVPGGIGPLAVVMIFKNLLELVRRA